MDYETLKREFEQNPAFAQTAAAPGRPPATSALREAARLRAASAGPTGVAAVLYAMGILGLVAGLFVLGMEANAGYRIAALVTMTAGFMTFCTAALLTELQRIKTVLLMGLPPVE